MDTQKRILAKVVIVSAVLAVALTWLYFIHEGLPKFLRAPTSLILAPVAIVDGMCYAIGVSGIYGKLFPVFLVNLIAATVFCCAAIAIKRRLSRKPSSSSSV